MTKFVISLVIQVFLVEKGIDDEDPVVKGREDVG